MALALLLAVFATIFTLLGPQIISKAIDNGMTEGGSRYGDMKYLIILGALYLFLHGGVVGAYSGARCHHLKDRSEHSA